MKKTRNRPVHILLPPLAFQAIEWLARQDDMSINAMARRLILRGLRETLSDEEKLLLQIEMETKENDDDT